MTAKSEGNRFQNDFKNSCPKDAIIDRIKDVPIFNRNPQCENCPHHKKDIPKISSNPCDFTMFYSPLLFYLELKSSKQKSFSFDEKIIKTKQIEGLLKKSKKPFTVPGFVLNFRNTSTNETYFVHIGDFIDYKNNTDRKSIPLEICQKIGVKIDNEIKISRYRYDLEKFAHHFIRKVTSHET